MDELLREERGKHSRGDEEDEEWEERDDRDDRDDRGNLWARGSEMKRRRRGNRGGGVSQVFPSQLYGQLLSPESSAYSMASLSCSLFFRLG